jgi:hypothetical protein
VTLSRAVALAVTAALLVAPAAGAKRFTKLVVVGSNGFSTVLRGSIADPFLPGFFSDPREQVEPQGPFFLLYPLFDRGVPAQPGRYYPEARVACFSWQRSGPAALADCARVSDVTAQRLDVRLPAVHGEPTTLTRLASKGYVRRLQSNGAVAMELALARWRLARPATRPLDCGRSDWVEAAWQGAEAAQRPTRFCLSLLGVWAAGRLYPQFGVWLT